MDDGFGLWDVLVSMVWFGLVVAWIWIVIAILADIFRDPDLSGVNKALWTAFIVLIPWLGVLCYIFTRGGAMGDRSRQSAHEQQVAMRQHAGTPAASSVTEELRGLAELHSSGVLSDAEYEAAKAKVLA